VQADALAPGARVLLVDDVLATGGTLAAARALADGLGADIVGASVLMELAFLGGRARWNGTVPLHAAWVP
jgi:adenine phosphoribosyltransferase